MRVEPRAGQPKGRACHLLGEPRACVMRFGSGTGGCIHGFTINGKERKSASTCVHFYERA